MANNDAPDSEQTVAPIYRVPADTTEHREALRRQWLELRAGILQDLLMLVSEESRGPALAILLQIAEMEGREHDMLRESWLREIQTAYVTGRAEVATEELQRLTGEPEVMSSEPSATIH